MAATGSRLSSRAQRVRSARGKLALAFIDLNSVNIIFNLEHFPRERERAAASGVKILSPVHVFCYFERVRAE